MKKILFLFALVFLFLNCKEENFPQSVTVTIPYQINSAGADSAFILLWKGNDVAQCPMLDSMEIANLDFSKVTKYVISLTGTQYILDLPPSGEMFKIGGYIKDGNLTSLLAVKVENYQLPVRPQRMIIGNIQMTY